MRHWRTGRPFCTLTCGPLLVGVAEPACVAVPGLVGAHAGGRAPRCRQGKVDAFDTWVTVSKPPPTTIAARMANTRLFRYGGGVLERADL